VYNITYNNVHDRHSDFFIARQFHNRKKNQCCFTLNYYVHICNKVNVYSGKKGKE
jgi:hypothetical protein